MNKKILVTGGNGFIGSHVVRKLLAQGDKPVILTRSSSDMWRLKAIINKISVFNIDEMPLNELFKSKNLSGVINLATYYKKQNSFEDIDKMVDSNIKFPSQLLQLCKYYNVPIFITAGSYFQYGVNSFSCTPESAIPRDFYAATKSALSKIMDYYTSSSSLRAMELVLFTPYGEMDHEEKLIPYLIRNTLTGKSVNLTGGFQKLNLVYVEDVASAFVNSLDSHIEENKSVHLNVASSISYSIRDIITVMEEILQKHINVNWNSFTASEMDKDYLLVVDTKTTEMKLQWKPRYDLYSGLKRTIEYYRGVLNGS
ncbi:MAG: NAD(P)-dependent oxidoreductase [Candidatus Thermoplasmatota archaeon]|nr:NAD(P)-dependent oxidoreductase [Candidatus Thermoplasmatota archaeon]